MTNLWIYELLNRKIKKTLVLRLLKDPYKFANPFLGLCWHSSSRFIILYILMLGTIIYLDPRLAYPIYTDIITSNVGADPHQPGHSAPCSRRDLYSSKEPCNFTFVCCPLSPPITPHHHAAGSVDSRPGEEQHVPACCHPQE